MRKLFSGLRIGELELGHRLVTTVRSKRSIDIVDYQRRATAGGLMVTEAHIERANDDRWKRVTDAIHSNGGVVVAMLTFESKHQWPQSIDVDQVMDDFGRAARNAHATGFDGVELDAAYGSLPDRFLQLQTNTREDEYSGDSECRMRFLLEAVHVATSEWTGERVGIRLSPCARDGQLELFATVMRALSERELAYVHLARVHGRRALLPDGKPVSIATCADRRAFRSDVSCALIASDYVDIDVAASAVESRWADAIGFFQASDEPDFICRLVRQERPHRT